MKMLAFDTSTTACTVALCNGDDIISLHKVAPMQQASLILSMINDLLRSFSLTVKELDAIAYGCGPGSFTGIRMASCVTQGLGFANQIPIIRISSLAVMAQAAFLEHEWTKLLVAVDARTDHLYWATYEYQNGNINLINQEEVSILKEITIPKGIDWYGIGDGWEKYRSQLVMRLGFEPIEVKASQLPTAQALLKLAQIKYRQGQWVGVAQAVPDYLR